MEIHGVTPQAVERDSLQSRTAGGNRFRLTASSGLKGYDLDIAMPRREEASGRGHRDFEIFTDPFPRYEESGRSGGTLP